jgi:hypothetical protein
VASLVRTKQAVMELIKADAQHRDPQHRKPLVVWLDGALCLWNLAPKLFKPWKRVTCVLDIMHVVRYVSTAAHALFPEGSRDGQHGVQAKLTAMLSGRGDYVIGGLRQILTKRRLRKAVRETLKKVITFFQNHRRWMQYDDYLAMGLPVGTGVVESACGSVVKHRMEGEGKRWSVEGAEAILALRSLKKSHDNDLRDYWWCRARQVLTRLYARKPKDWPTARLRRVAWLGSKRSRSSQAVEHSPMRNGSLLYAPQRCARVSSPVCSWFRPPCVDAERQRSPALSSVRCSAWLALRSALIVEKFANGLPALCVEAEHRAHKHVIDPSEVLDLRRRERG